MVFTTLSDYIQRYKDSILKESNFSFNQWVFDNELIEDDEILNKNLDYIKLLDENIIDQHSYYIDKYVYLVRLTDEEYRKYRCNAHRLSYDIFGTTMLWYMILGINEMYSESEFNKYIFKMYKPEMVSHLAEIKLVEDDLLDRNKAETAKFGNALKVFFDSIDKEENEIEYDAV
jgi:hypothetical protein